MSGDEFEGRPGLVRLRARTLALQRITIAIAVLFVLLTEALLAYNAIVALDSRETLLDCTQPDGQCYIEGQERLATVVENLVDAHRERETTTRRIVVLAAACADDPAVSTVEEIQRCVDRELERSKK